MFSFPPQNRRDKPKIDEKGRRFFGRRTLVCAHGINRASNSKGDRPLQHIKFTNCPVQVNINEQYDGSWMVTKCVLDHSGHPVTSHDFFSHESYKRLTEDDKEFIKGLIRAKTTSRNIAAVMTERTGRAYTYQDVRNIIERINLNIEQVPLEQALGSIVTAGGNIKYQKESGTDNVNCLWLQTRDMKEQLSKSKPHIFETDTTFNTQSEGYKLFIPVYKCHETDRWEIAGLLFLATETRENVEAGLNFFKDSIPYANDFSQFVFITDKDFDYIDVSKALSSGRLHSFDSLKS